MAENVVLEGLTTGQLASLQLFREVVADRRDMSGTLHLLRSCSWNVEQALQLHWASVEDAEAAPVAAAAVQSENNGLGEPLLSRNGQMSPISDDVAHTPVMNPPSRRSRYAKVVGWFTQRLRHIGTSVYGVLHVFYTFILGPRGSQADTRHASGSGFGRALSSTYGAQWLWPRFFEGSFSQSLQKAQRECKLVVAYLHSEDAPHSQSFCTEVLSNEFVRDMMNENFLAWGGDVARMESHHVAQLIHAREYPCLSVLMPASVDDVRVIGSLCGQIRTDAVVALLANSFDRMESHRAEAIARREQQAEDRHLREAQDREFQEALEMDKRRAAQLEQQRRAELETQRIAEEERQKTQEMIDRREEQQNLLVEQRKRKAAVLEVEGPEAKSRISLRLPAGQRIQRKFSPTATLADVYTWADCAAYLPENEGKGLEVPNQFTLRTSFPSNDLTEMESTIADLQLASTNILLTEIEDEDN